MPRLVHNLVTTASLGRAEWGTDAGRQCGAISLRTVGAARGSGEA
jgi:hypothetical protein